MDAASATDTERLRAEVEALLPRLAERGPEIEDARRLPPDLVAELTAAGIFRMLVPRTHGGFGIDYPESIDVLAALASADGATGWTAMIGCETAQLFSLLPRDTFESIYADGPDVICGGAFAPQGKATPVDGGYRVSGRWGFASGCQHSHWLFGNCVVLGTDGAPQAAATGEGPRTLCAVLPASEWRIHDDSWRTAGMRGTGSHDIEIADAFVAEDWTFDLFGGRPQLEGPLFAAPLLQFSQHIGAVALGIAEGAVEDLAQVGRGKKTRLYARASLAESQLFQHRLGHVEADVRAARALLETQVREYWSLASSGGCPPELQGKVLQSVAWVAETAARVVDTCYTCAGGSALYDASPLQRRLRDIHALTQHASVQESVFASAGARRLGESGPLVI